MTLSHTGPQKSVQVVHGYRRPYKARYTALYPYGGTSYGISEDLICPDVRVKNSERMYEIIYRKYMVVYTHKAVYTH